MSDQICNPQSEIRNGFLSAAIDLARDGMRANFGGPFGAVVVKEGVIVGRGCNQVTSTNDPTAHAEIVAIRDACRTLKTFSLASCEIYASCEPCPMCLAAIYWARIERVYYGCSCADADAIDFSDSLIRDELSLPISARKVPLIPLGRGEALALFDEWRAKADKTPY
ncbi:MAG TPA: nucleoside deaminase [Pirellulaceae bacterium]|nr:nucleoside deaminase [Pirellulaceae bacterium]